MSKENLSQEVAQEEFNQYNEFNENEDENNCPLCKEIFSPHENENNKKINKNNNPSEISQKYSTKVGNVLEKENDMKHLKIELKDDLAKKNQDAFVKNKNDFSQEKDNSEKVLIFSVKSFQSSNIEKNSDNITLIGKKTLNNKSELFNDEQEEIIKQYRLPDNVFNNNSGSLFERMYGEKEDEEDEEFLKDNKNCEIEEKFSPKEEIINIRKNQIQNNLMIEDNEKIQREKKFEDTNNEFSDHLIKPKMTNYKAVKNK